MAQISRDTWRDPTKVELSNLIQVYLIQVYLIQVTCDMLGLVGEAYKYEAFARVILTINQESKEVRLRGEVLP